MVNERQELDRLRKAKRLRELELKQGKGNVNLNSDSMGIPSVNRLASGQVEPIAQPEQEKGFLDSVGEFFTGSDRETQATKELPEMGGGGLLFGEDNLKAKAITPALLTATNPEEMAQILQSNFDNIGIQSDPKGNLIAVNNKTGVKVVLNKPGFSQIDVMQALGLAAAFTHVGRVAGALKVGGSAGATSAGIEALQALSGGEFDASQVAIDTVTAGVLDKAFEVSKATGRSIRDVLRKDAKIDPDQILKSFDPQGFTSKNLGSGRTPFAPKDTATQTIKKATQADLTPEALQKIRAAEGQGVQLSKAQATGDFGASDAEQTLLKSVSPEGIQARQFADTQQEQLKAASKAFTDKFGGSARLTEATGDLAEETARDKGFQIQGELLDIKEFGRKEVNELYKLAGESTGEAVPLNNSSIVEIADEIIVNRPITPEVEKSINTALAKFGLVGDSVEQSSRNKFKVTDGADSITITGEVTPLTLNNAEDFRQALNKAVGADQTGSAKIVVNALDEQVNLVIKEGAKKTLLPVKITELKNNGIKIESDNGKFFGTLNGDDFTIGGVTIKDTLKRGKGEGRGLYLSAIDEAKKRGAKNFISDESVTPEAARVWESLKKDGFPVVKNKDARFIQDKNGGFFGVTGDLPVYTMDLTKEALGAKSRTSAFKQARDAFAAEKSKFSAKDIVEKLTSFKRGTATPEVDPESVINKIVKGDKAVTNIRKVKKILLENPTDSSKKAWQSIQAEAVGDILSQAVNKDTLEMSGARLNSAIKAYRPEALRELLGKKQFAELKRLQQTMGDATIAPSGTTNPSGTFNKLFNAMERLGNLAGGGQVNFGSLAISGVKKGKELAKRKKTLDGIVNTKIETLKAKNPKMSKSSLEKAARTLAFLQIRELDKENK
ncbi:MAG: hypothetical protein Unbinned1520contig1002_12 [Prokaryotic dsDNA virus sp.]|nr:MAG: hypothetical protein Unbinned1520contig1002_12 [Prokaryotic dsDNA virus sp.]|tara:strand:+ start:26960 stop:29647 length:2688 start_codon:yes stop_codon:yes gene_type:complete